ncbi:hypothetical protein H8F21_28985 [Pseudomonas sp. P66]|uniref:Uncharacterized protein n=1 Tax=Pseudomonas arcuscaelestis TaxID=2710591 RepID=A0ABS2C769_9PSED|nr:hypothetical protein [Pseudomonas arcuscaelestis]MBM5461590.1 hypothetical protein [Pseudomonas arcuscaelestis]
MTVLILGAIRDALRVCLRLSMYSPAAVRCSIGKLGLRDRRNPRQRKI